jgi:hypothetical protein
MGVAWITRRLSTSRRRGRRSGRQPAGEQQPYERRNGDPQRLELDRRVAETNERIEIEGDRRERHGGECIEHRW